MSAPAIPAVRGKGKGCPMDGQDGGSQPYVDPAVLQTLRCELEPDPDYCIVFVNSYIQQLPQRLDLLSFWAKVAASVSASMKAL